MNTDSRESDEFAAMPALMSPAMLSEQLPETAVKTLQKWRSLGVGPEWSRDAGTGKVYYRKAKVVAWLLNNSHTSTDSKKPEVAASGQTNN